MKKPPALLMVNKYTSVNVNKSPVLKLRSLYERKGVNIIAAECCSDHIHISVEIPSQMSVVQFIGCLKGKSSLKEFVDLFTGESVNEGRGKKN